MGVQEWIGKKKTEKPKMTPRNIKRMDQGAAKAVYSNAMAATSTRRCYVVVRSSRSSNKGQQSLPARWRKKTRAMMAWSGLSTSKGMVCKFELNKSALLLVLTCLSLFILFCARCLQDIDLLSAEEQHVSEYSGWLGEKQDPKT